RRVPHANSVPRSCESGEREQTWTSGGIEEGHDDDQHRDRRKGSILQSMTLREQCEDPA
ncbi:unnamed protein product, partial [Amoebophrya sp. A120]